ncbi:EKC/KEOPS complex subunit Gon7 [Penicillium sp. IBT 35674x]|nr:EKC/KEOPS complex subunit Gon7 [Penicillium sp. IBT 35674x]
MANTPLQAVYTAPDATKSFQHAIPMTSGTAADPLATKLTHLRALQSLVPKLQDEINVYLTARMEEDKKAQGQTSEKEAKEEENYGEEVVEDDA